MSHSRQRLGEWGEGVAALHLEKKGFTIIERNWRSATGEIDMVALDGQEYVFVEVKTRRGQAMGPPETALTPKKSQKLMDLARQYLAEHELEPDWRIDFVAVELDSRGKLIRCEHLTNAVLGW